MLYRLSKLIPVPMRSTYTVETAEAKWRERATWVQWRHHILCHRRTMITIQGDLNV